MEEFLRYMVQQLVEHPEEALLTHRKSGGKIIYQLSLRKSDVGRLIGKGGNTITAIRELLTAAGEKQGVKVALEILD
jgi:predicted RNA-binding protein YlqC (UPF0109 family)